MNADTFDDYNIFLSQNCKSRIFFEHTIMTTICILNHEDCNILGLPMYE